MQRIHSFLRQSDTVDFRDADDFADAIVDEIKNAYGGSFKTPRAEAVVKRTTKEIYTFYRLRDTSPFGEAQAPRLTFGGPDTRAINFFNKLDGFYFSSFIDNRSPELHKFIREEYLEKGASLFGRETGETLDDFRNAVGGRLRNLNDHAVKTIITSSVQRIRSYAHILSLGQGQYKFGRIAAIMDRKTSPICIRLDGKYIRIGAAVKTVQRLTKLSPGDYALEMYKSDAGQAYSRDPVAYVESRVGDDGVIDDSLVAEGRGFPPYHPNCRSWIEAVIPGAGGPRSGAEQAEEDERRR